MCIAYVFLTLAACVLSFPFQLGSTDFTPLLFVAAGHNLVETIRKATNTSLSLARHKCQTFTANASHTYFRLGRWWFCRPGGWGASILLLNSSHDGCRSWCSWNTLSSEGFRSHQCLSQFLKKEASPLELPPVSIFVYCHPDDKGVVC